MSAEDPQVERGYIKIAWELQWAFDRARLSPQKRSIIGCILFYTYGRGKKSAEIAFDKFTEYTGMTKDNISRTIKKLKINNVIRVVRTDNKRFASYGINKAYKSWKVLSKQTTLLSIQTPNVVRLDNQLPSSKQIKKHKVSEAPVKNSNKETIERVIRYLNAKTGKNFKPTTPETIKLINGRIQENYQPEHFKTVIDKKCSEWMGDPHWEKFLRPNTLFRPSNFESYLNQPTHIPPGESPRTPKAL